MVLNKEMKGKAPARKNRRSWKRMFEVKKELKKMEAEAKKLKAETERLKEEGRNAEEELEAKESELGLIKEEYMMAVEENAAIQLCFDAALLILARDARAHPRRRRRFFSVQGSESHGG